MTLDRRTIAVSAALPAGSSYVCAAIAQFLGRLLVFSRASGNDFVNYDDPVYLTENPPVQAGLTLKGIRWALTTEAANCTHLDFTHGGLVCI